MPSTQIPRELRTNPEGNSEHVPPWSGYTLPPEWMNSLRLSLPLFPCVTLAGGVSDCCLFPGERMAFTSMETGLGFDASESFSKTEQEH